LESHRFALLFIFRLNAQNNTMISFKISVTIFFKFYATSFPSQHYSLELNRCDLNSLTKLIGRELFGDKCELDAQKISNDLNQNKFIA
ncbi:hypothetical protein HZS_7615, partial [Henneguya salminicola]